MTKHWWYIGFIVIFLSIVSYPMFDFSNSMRSYDWRNSETPGYFFLKQGLTNKEIPLWDYMTFSGRPMFGYGMPIYYPPAIIFSIFLSPYAVMNLMVILHLLLAGLGMYFLAHDILKNKMASLLSAMIFSFAPIVTYNLNHPYLLYGISYIPLLFLLARKVIEGKSMISYTILLAVISALQFLSGGIIHWYYSVGFILFYLIYSFVLKKQYAKLIVVAVIFSVLMFMLIGIKFLPANEHTSYTIRGAGLSVEEILGAGHINKDNWVDKFFYGSRDSTKEGHVGLVGLVLAVFGIFSVLKQNKRLGFFLLLMGFCAVLYSTGSLTALLYFVPGVSSMRGPDKILIFYVFAMSLFAGFGVKYLHRNKLASFIIVLICLLSLFFVNQHILTDFYNNMEHYSVTENNPVFQEMAKDEDVFRFHIAEITSINWNFFLGSTVPLKLESLYGQYGGGFDRRYFHQHMSIVLTSAKLLGMQNVKYIISSNELNYSAFEYLDKYDNVPLHTIDYQGYGNEAYLYYNMFYLPRAFIVPNSVLIVGNDAEEVMYNLMQDPWFNPSRLVIIPGKSNLDDYTFEEIKNFDAIILLPLSTNSMQALEGYEGIVLPDVRQGVQSVTEQDLDNLFIEMNKGQPEKVEMLEYYDTTSNTMKIKSPKEGWLFVSDKFTLYPGWHVNPETTIHQANGVLSAVYVQPGEVEFNYMPRSFNSGVTRTAFACMFIGIYLIARGSRIWKKQ